MKTIGVAALLAVVLALLGVGRAEAQGFGQNKVQYRNLEWRTINTAHFDVYFYEGEQEAATDAARMAERAYKRLSTILDHQIRDKVPLILYASQSDFQATNVSDALVGEGTGGFTEFSKRRVTIPFTGGYARPRPRPDARAGPRLPDGHPLRAWRRSRDGESLRRLRAAPLVHGGDGRVPLPHEGRQPDRDVAARRRAAGLPDPGARARHDL